MVPVTFQIVDVSMNHKKAHTGLRVSAKMNRARLERITGGGSSDASVNSKENKITKGGGEVTQVEFQVKEAMQIKEEESNSKQLLVVKPDQERVQERI